MKEGLSSEQEKKRCAIIGPNVVHIDEPSFLKIMVAEFSRIFYVYQNFMTWTWINYSYWHMGIVNTLVYTLGGVTVSIITYRNALRLKDLCRVDGAVDALRNGVFTSVDQSKLVPGDVISLSSGMVFCDVVVLSGK
jgi:magnesium-transporting ATPase (P-type)